MALNPKLRYPGQILLGASGFPYGAAQNDLVENDGTGTPFEKDLVNDIFGFQQALLTEGGVTPSGIPDAVGASDYLSALKIVATAEANLVVAPVLTRLYHSALQTWRFSTPVTVFGSNQIVALVGLDMLRGYDINGDRQRPLAVLTASTGGANPASLSRSSDGSVWESLVALSPTYNGPTDMFPGAPNAIVAISSAGGLFEYSIDQGSTWNLATGLSGTTLSGHYFLSHGYFFHTATALVQCNVLGGSFTTHTVSGVSSFSVGSEWADDGNNTLCLLAKVNGQSFYSVITSTNGGATFSKTFDCASGSTNANITFNKQLALFVIWDDSGALYTSSDGAAWTQVAGTATPGNGFISGVHTMCSAGPAIVKSAENSDSLGSTGIAYTLNLGASWNYFYFGSPGVPVRIRGFNNRVYAYDLYRLWISGPLGVPRAVI